MDSQQIISRFEDIKVLKSEYLHSIWHDTLALMTPIKNKISNDLYDRLKVELDCVYYESIYGGDKEDERMVRDHFIRVVDEVIAELS